MEILHLSNSIFCAEHTNLSPGHAWQRCLLQTCRDSTAKPHTRPPPPSPCTSQFCEAVLPRWHAIVKQQLIFIGSSSEVRNKGFSSTIVGGLGQYASLPISKQLKAHKLPLHSCFHCFPCHLAHSIISCLFHLSCSHTLIPLFSSSFPTLHHSPF